MLYKQLTGRALIFLMNVIPLIKLFDDDVDGILVHSWWGDMVVTSRDIEPLYMNIIAYRLKYQSVLACMLAYY